MIAAVTGPAIGDEARSATLRVPAATDALGLVRLFAASLGRHLDVPSDVIEDLKLALTEVCSAAIESSSPREDVEHEVVKVAVRWHPDPAELVVRVFASSSFSIEGGATEDRARLLSALRLVLRSTDDGHGVEFTISTNSPG